MFSDFAVKTGGCSVCSVSSVQSKESNLECTAWGGADRVLQKHAAVYVGW